MPVNLHSIVLCGGSYLQMAAAFSYILEYNE